MSQQKNSRFVYSTDGSHKNICKSCQESPCRCAQPQEVVPTNTTLKLRLESKGRGGKFVTVIFELPFNPDYFKTLGKKAKSFCGSGGAYKDGQIEIQGDQREKLAPWLEKQGFKVKLAGG